MKKLPNIRQIQVYDKAVERGGSMELYRYYVKFPEIRLMGKWLLECGFHPGQYIEVHTEANKLVIVPAPLAKLREDLQ